MIGIIGAMEDELQLLGSRIQDKKEQNVGPFTFINGMLDGQQVVLLHSGIGKVNAAVGCTIMIERYDCELVINTGSAGGISTELSFGDVVVSTGLLYHDVDVRAFGYASGQIPGSPQIFPAAKTLIQAAEKAISDLKQEGTLPASLHSLRGLIGSGDIFMHEEQKIREVQELFPAMLAVEMEGAAIAHVCNLFNVPFLVIRSVSDVAGKESPMKFDEFLPLASKHSGSIVIRLVRDWQKE